MTISIERYVDITSGVGGASAVPRRDLVLRQITQNLLVPAGAVVSFSNLTDVGDYFGAAADEYKVAEKYFGFVSKQIVSPQRMSVIRWTPAATPPAVYGGPIVTGVTQFAAVTAGTLDFLVDGVSVTVGGIDLSTATTMALVASLMQTEIRANANPQLAQATVQYETNRGVFILTGAVATAGATLELVPGAVADVSGIIGWSNGLQIEQTGQAAHTPVQAVSSSANEDNNFGSFAFTGAVLPTQLELVDVAAWNHAENNKFLFCVAVLAANAAAFFDLVKGYSGCCVTLVPGPSKPADHAETLPAEILAATNYSRPAASQNFMFYQSVERTPTVNSNPAADTYDALRINYMGQTQTAGQKIAFYQRGFLMGGPTAALDMTVYTGEMWFKDAAVAVIMNGFLALPNMPANEDGKITVLSLLQEPIDQALSNGVFSVGKTLDAVQKAYITQVTANSDAWRQVQSKGYWVDAAIRSEVISGVTTYFAEYVLIYGKNDQIRKVTGSDILI